MKITVNDVMALGPCYPRERVEAMFAGATYVTPREIAESGIPTNDKVWLLIALLPESDQHEAACHFAEEVAHLAADPGVARHSIATKRAWVRGEATEDELSAAYSAARDAAEVIYQDAAWYASWAATEAIDRNSSRDAAWDAAWDAMKAIAKVSGSIARAIDRDAAEAAAQAAAREQQVAYLVQKLGG